MQQRNRIGFALAGVPVAMLVLAFLALAGSPPKAWAQAEDSWGVDGGEARRQEIIRRYLVILEARPERGVIFDRLLQELGGGARFESTLTRYAERSEADPSSFADAMLLGHLLAHAERLDEALAAYERAAEASPDDGRPLHARADVLARLERRDEARAAYEAALELAGDDDARSDVLRALADLAFEDRQWEDAGTYVEALIALAPRDPYVRMELAEVYTEHQRYDDALAQYEAVAELAGRDTRQRAMALRDQGDVLSLMGEGDEALARYQRAMGLVSDGYWLQRELEQRVIAVYRQDNRLDELVAEYEARWRRPNARQALLLASLYDELGRLEAAEEVLVGALQRASRSTDVRLALIRVLERRGDIEGVIEQYQTLRRLQPSDTSIAFRLVDLYRRIGEREQALELLGQVARQARSNPYALLEIADRYLRLGARDDALAMYERLVEVAPNDPDNVIALGEFHFMDGRRSEAERTWRQVLEIVEDPAEGHAMLGTVFADHALYEEALEQLEAARSLRPEDDGLLREVARLYEEVDAAPLALRHWEELHGRSDQAQMRVEARGAMIRLYDTLGRLSDEVELRREDLEVNPRDGDSAYFVAEALRALGDIDGAEAVYAAWIEAMEDDTQVVPALLALENIYSDQNRVSDAIDVLIRIAAASPQRARDTYHRLAELSLRTYDDAEAVRFAQLAVELNPDNALAHARLGDILRRMQDLDGAILAYRQALLLDERAFPFYFELAEIFLAVDRTNDAEALYRTVIEESDDAALILRAGRRSIVLREPDHRIEGLLGALEARMYDPDKGATFLQLLVEAYDRLTGPLIERARFGESADAARAEEELDRVARRALRPLLDALAGDDVRMRETALRILAAQENPSAAQPLARLMSDGDATLRLEAAVAVARIADPRTAQALADVAARGDLTLRLVAAWGLGRVGSEEAALALSRLLADDATPEALRALAVASLARCPAAESADLLAALAQSSRSTRRAAAWGVGVHATPGASDALRLLVQHGRTDVAAAAVWALGRAPDVERSLPVLAEAFFLAPPAVGRMAEASLAGRASDAVLAEELERYERGLGFLDRSASAFDVDAWLDGMLDAGALATRHADATDGDSPENSARSAALASAWALALDADAASRERALRFSARALAEEGGSEALVGPDGLREAMRHAANAELTLLVRLSGSPHSASAAAALRTASLAAPANDETLALALRLVDEGVAPALRAAALEALIRGASPLAEARVEQHLASEDWRARRDAALALHACVSCTPPVAASLEAALDAETIPSAQAAAWGALVRLAPSSAGRRVPAMWADATPLLRLAMLRDRGALPADARAWLLDAAARDSDTRVRAQALSAGGS